MLLHLRCTHTQNHVSDVENGERKKTLYVVINNKHRGLLENNRKRPEYKQIYGASEGCASASYIENNSRSTATQGTILSSEDSKLK
jgi:hypothetical protein